MRFRRSLLTRLMQCWPFFLVIFGTCSGSWSEPEIGAKDKRYQITGSIPFPRRPLGAMTGRQFLLATAGLEKKDREAAIAREIGRGNMPSFSRALIPIRLKMRDGKGWMRGTVWVSPQYLAIGSDLDYTFIPMNFLTATGIARRFGYVLPTKKMVDEIYRQAESRVEPKPMPAGPLMESNGYYARHNEMVQANLKGFRSTGLAAGYKKDVVVSNILNRSMWRIAIYGWHRGLGRPIQPLSTAHHAGYADYSHGIRLVSAIMRLDGRTVSIYDVLGHARLSAIASDEGPIRNLKFMMGGYKGFRK